MHVTELKKTDLTKCHAGGQTRDRRRISHDCRLVQSCIVKNFPLKQCGHVVILWQTSVNIQKSLLRISRGTYVILISNSYDFSLQAVISVQVKPHHYYQSAKQRCCRWLKESVRGGWDQAKPNMSGEWYRHNELPSVLQQRGGKIRCM